VNRIPRRFVDRLLSIAYPVHRYHCRSFICNWEGNLLYDAEAPDPSGSVSTDSPDQGPPSTIAPGR